MMQEVILIAHIWAKKDKYIELKRELASLVEQTLAELCLNSTVIIYQPVL